MALDMTMLEDLKLIMEDEFPTLVTTYISDSRKRLERLRQAVSERDNNTVRSEAHSFKGSSSNISALGLADLCLQLEQCGSSGQLATASALLESIESEYMRVESQLKSLV